MSKTKLGYVLAATVMATSLGGYALGQFQLRPSTKATGMNPPIAAGGNVVMPYPPPITTDGSAPAPPAPITNKGNVGLVVPTEPMAAEAKIAKVESPKPSTGRRREAVIKMPVGTFVKDMDVGQYGSGRLTWTFEDDKVLGTIEANVMGVEVELRTEAEFSMSSSGTIYGIVTGVELTHLKIGAGGALGEFGELAEYAKFVKLAEPLINEMLTDLPFSYQFRVSGDKLTILNYRALLSGPNPLGKLGGVVGGADSGLAALAGFQALGVAIEGTYTAGEAEPRDKKAKQVIRKSNTK